MNATDPIVKVYSFQVRNPFLKDSKFGTVIHTQSQATLNKFKTAPNYNTRAIKWKVATRLFRKSVADQLFPL